MKFKQLPAVCFGSFAFIMLMMLATTGFSQQIAYYKGSDCSINTADDVNNGCSSNNYLYVQYQNFPSSGVNIAAGWSLRVQANGDFTNGSAVIPSQFISLGFNSVDGGPSGISGTGNKALSKTTAQPLITSSTALQSPPHYYFVHRFNMIVSGGSQLLAGPGTYSGTVTLSLVAQDGTVISTNNNVALSFVVNFSNTCAGATINSYSSNQFTFADYSQQMAGRTVTDAVSVQYNPNQATCTGWSLKVRAEGNFISGSNSVPIQYFALRFNRVAAGQPTAAQIGVTNNPVPLSFNDAALIDQSDKGFTAYSGTEHKFDMIITGGNHMLVPNGTYRANLVFTLVNQYNQVVSTKTQEVTFQVNSSTNSYTLVMQNNSNVINLVFNTLANYTSGVSVTKDKALKITGNSAYQVLIKTSGMNLLGDGNAAIPVGVVNVQATKDTWTFGGTVNTYSRSLSTADQVLITNSVSNFTMYTVEYDLKYFTNPGDSRLSGKGGTFNTTVFFVAIPQ